MYVRTLGFHEPTQQVWQFVSELDAAGLDDDVLRTVIAQAAEHDRQGLIQLIPDQYLPVIEWYASVTNDPPEPIDTGAT